MYPSMPCRFPGPHPWGSLRGLARGVSRPIPGGSPGPHPGGRGCIPACTEAEPLADSYCCGQYTSYWNAFLFMTYFTGLVRVMAPSPPSPRSATSWVLAPDLVKLVHKWAPSRISRSYIYWGKGGRPSTERHSCLIITQIDAAIKFSGISMETPALIMTGN